MRQVLALWCIGLLLLHQGGSFPVTLSAAANDRSHDGFWGLYAASNLQQLAAYQAISNYTHHLPAILRLNGMVNVGADARLRNVVTKLLNGEHVTVGVIGGSTSWGYGVQRRKTDWFSVFISYLQRAFPSATIKARNGCVRAAQSEFISVCLEKFVDQHVDLVFVELTANDGYLDASVNNPYSQAFERLVRKLLKFPNKPAVVIMHTLHPGAKHLQLPFYNTLEDHYNVISQYYQLPSLSLRGAIWQGLVNNWEGYTAKDIFIGMETVSQRHLNELGHKYLTDLAVGLVQQTYQEVLLQPYTLADMLESQSVPPPLFPDNHENQNMACATGMDILGAVMPDHTGWAFVNEGTGHRPRWGYVSQTPGSILVLNLDTRSSAQHPILQPTLQQKLHVLTQHDMVAAAAALQQKATHAAKAFSPETAAAAAAAQDLRPMQGIFGVLQGGGLAAAIAESDRQAKLAAELLHSGRYHHHHRPGGLGLGVGLGGSGISGGQVLGGHGGRFSLPADALQGLGATKTHTGVEVVAGKRLLERSAGSHMAGSSSGSALSGRGSRRTLSNISSSQRDVIPPPADAVYLRPGMNYTNPDSSSSGGGRGSGSSTATPVPVSATTIPQAVDTGTVLPGALISLAQQLPTSNMSVQQGNMLVWIGYLQSHHMMGRARMYCISGCTCQELVVDAWHNQAKSQTQMVKLRTTQSSECLVGVEVLEGTSSARHKFKVTGVVVSRAAEYERTSDLTEQYLMAAADDAAAAEGDAHLAAAGHD